MLKTEAAIHAELAVIRAQMQAIESTLPAGQCALWACDMLYERQEQLRAALGEAEGAAK